MTKDHQSKRVQVAWDSPRWGLSSGELLGTTTDGWMIVSGHAAHWIWVHESLLRGSGVSF
jgi:hypothetical protein